MAEDAEEILEQGRDDALLREVTRVSKEPDDELTIEESYVLEDREVILPKGYLSPTQIEMYLRCPKQFEMRYVRGFSSPPGVALVEGSSHHVALEFNNKHKIETHEDASAKDVEFRFFDAWDKKRTEIGDWGDDSQKVVETRARKLIRTYMGDVAKRLKPLASERPVAFKVGPVIVAGVIDWEGHVVSGSCSAKKPSAILDYKVLSKRKSATELGSSVQLSSYTAFHRSRGNRGVKVGFCQLLKKTGSVVIDDTKITDARIRWFRFIVLSVADSISRGCFPLTSPVSWACSERFCGFWNSCRGRIEGGVGCSRDV